MPRFIIKLDREKCIGSGACTAAAPSFWRLEEEKTNIIGGTKNADNSIQTREIDEKYLKCNADAAESCPVNAIHILKKDTGEKLI
ncbi:ferredoxin [Candidatus Woesearchaeota archaeon]|nr:ferredoxin [Candidatus Woesearchaeota archaeon]